MKQGKEYGKKIAFYCAFFIVWVLLTRGANAPLIYPDEAGYIGWARRLSGTDAQVWRYLPGYGLLLAPLFGLFQNFTVSYQAAILLNCLMGAAIPVLVAGFLEKTELLTSRERWLAAAVPGLYPAVMLYGNLALCEVWLTFLCTLLLWSVAHWGKKRRYVVLSVLCCCWMIAGHGRSGAAILGTLAAAVAYFWDTPRQKQMITAVAALLVILGLAGLWYLGGTSSVNGAHLREQLVKLFTWQGVWNTVSTLFSQGYYLLLASFGILIPGVFYGILQLRKKNQPALWCLFVTFGAAMLLSALFMNHHEKPDHILYGRYNEYALSGMLALGAAAILKKKNCRWMPLIFGSFAVFCFTRYGAVIDGIDRNLCHTWGLYWYKILFSRFTFWGVTAWFALPSLMLAGIGRHNPKGGILFLCALFLMTTVYGKYDYFIKGAAPRYAPSQLPEFAENTVTALPLEGDTMGYPWGVYHLLTCRPELHLSEQSSLLLSPKRQEGGRLLGSECYDQLYLYEKEGADKIYSAVGDAPSGTVSFEKTHEGQLQVTVQNTGSPWICYQGAENLADCVRLAVWTENEKGITEEMRLDFSGNLYQGEQETVVLPLPQKSGSYRIQAAVVTDFKSMVAVSACDVTIRDGAVLDYNGTDPTDTEFTVLQVRDYPRQTEGLFRGRSTGETTLSGLCWNTGGRRLLSVKFSGRGTGISLAVNGQVMPCVKQGSSFYTVSIEGISEIRSITMTCPTAVPAKQNGLPSFLFWLRADSPCKPVSLFIRGMDKLFGAGWDFCAYGAAPERFVLTNE